MNKKRPAPHGCTPLYRTLAIIAPGKKEPKSHVNIPPSSAVEEAKKWVEENKL